MKTVQFFLIVSCIAFLGYAGYQNREQVIGFFIGEPKYIVQVGGVKIFVKIADEPHERIQGLSGTESLGDFEGLLFAFDSSDRHGVWMKDMNYPIDIIWLNEEGVIVHIETRVSPRTYPKTFRPPVPARYVLEMNERMVESFNIRTGQQVILPAPLSGQSLSN